MISSHFSCQSFFPWDPIEKHSTWCSAQNQTCRENPKINVKHSPKTNQPDQFECTCIPDIWTTPAAGSVKNFVSPLLYMLHIRASGPCHSKSELVLTLTRVLQIAYAFVYSILHGKAMSCFYYFQAKDLDSATRSKSLRASIQIQASILPALLRFT